jgi:hypothetical protein
VRLTGLAGMDDAAVAADPAVSVEPWDEAVQVEHDLVDQIAALERVRAGAEAAQLRVMAELAGRAMFAGCAEHGHGDPAHGIRGAASIISAELRLPPSAAVARTTLAVELVQELPTTLAELAGGRIDGYRARVIAEQTRPLAHTPQLRRDVEAALLRKGAAADRHPTARRRGHGGAGRRPGRCGAAASAGPGRPVRVAAVPGTRRHGQPAEPDARRRRRRPLHRHRRRRPPPPADRRRRNRRRHRPRRR